MQKRKMERLVLKNKFKMGHKVEEKQAWKVSTHHKLSCYGSL
jgi:hypothetical protein